MQMSFAPQERSEDVEEGDTLVLSFGFVDFSHLIDPPLEYSWTVRRGRGGQEGRSEPFDERLGIAVPEVSGSVTVQEGRD